MEKHLDPIVEEVREARNAHAEKFNYDLAEIVKDIKIRQKKYGSRIVKRQPRLCLRDAG